MAKHPKVRLSRLRKIGWSAWDPIGLLDEGVSWENLTYADEYDGYLVRAAGMIKRLEPKEDVIDYLVSIVIDHMGMPAHPDVRIAAEKVVQLIEADDKLWNFNG